MARRHSPWARRTPATDGRWLHWNHDYLPHWDKRVTAKFPRGRHQPPDDIGSTFYPELGPYSSRDSAVIDSHMQQLVQAGNDNEQLQKKRMRE